MTEAHHALATHELVLLLETDLTRRLTTAEADDRLRRFGRDVARRLVSIRERFERLAH